MKIRIGFVSNSSTSSFVCNIEGNVFSLSDVVRKMKMLVKFYEDFIDSDRYYIKFTEDSYKVFVADDKYVEDMLYWDKNSEKMKDKIIIEGTGDNSIPSMFFDLIEESFNATRYHLG